MKLHYLLLLCLTFIQPIICMEPERTNENSASLELHIDALAAKIELLQSEISLLDKVKDAELIAAKEKSVQIFISQKKQFQELKKRFEEISDEIFATTAVQDQYNEHDFDDPIMKQRIASLQDKSRDELHDLLRQVEDQKSYAFLELSDLFYDSGNTKQDIGVVVKDVLFSQQNSLLNNHIPHLQKFSLRQITHLESDAASEILQCEVMNQFQAGGTASCSYHAIKNGIMLLLAMHAEPKMQKYVIKNLQIKSLVIALFGYFEAPWRSRIITFRKKYIIKDYIKNLLIYCLHGNKKFMKTDLVNNHAVSAPARPKNVESCHPFCFADYANWVVCAPYKDEPYYEESVRLAYLYLINEVALDIIENIEVEAVQTAPIVIKPHKIISSFKNAINKQIAKGTLQYKQDSSMAKAFGHEPYVVDYENLLDESLILQYFPMLPKLEFVINDTIWDSISKRRFDSNVFNYYVGCGKIEFNKIYCGFAGEMAEADELKLIIEYEKNNGFLKLINDLKSNYFILFAGDSALTPEGMPTFEGNLVFHAGSEVFYEETFGKIRDALQEENSNFTALVIFHINAHWVTLVINKVGNAKQYVITDSITSPGQPSSQLRIYDPFIHEFIRLAEGVEVSEAAHYSVKKNDAQGGMCTIS